MKRALLAIAVAAAAVSVYACVRPPPSDAAPKYEGCGKDTDCKGARICQRGACVDPPPPPRDLAVADAAPDAGPPATPLVVSDGGVVPALALNGASPLFHADRAHTGRSRFRVSPTAPSELARVATGGVVVSSPAIADDGTAYFGSHDRAVRAAAPDGAVRWTQTTGDLVWCSPALGPSGVVYVGSDDDHLYALDAATGAVRWSYLAGPCKRAKGVGPEAARCDVDGVTIGVDGAIWFVADGAYALAPDGTKRWEFRAGADVDSPPAVAADGTIYFGADDRKLYALSPSGALKWALLVGGDVRTSPAIAADGTVYAGAFDGGLYAVRPNGTVAWTFKAADRILSSPVIDAGGLILFGSQDDRLYAVAPDGKLAWSILLGGDVDGTPAIGPDGVIWVGSDDKAIHILK